ncbi:MAG: AbiEi antitoxin N-terminal domain-containing protein [Nibricoccus sp.]
MKAKTRSDLLREQFAEETVIRAADLARRGFSGVYLQTAVKQGVVERLGRGLYTVPGAQTTEKHHFVQVARRVPNAVICLMSALIFHQFTTQLPNSVWFAIGSKDWMPKLDFVKYKVFRFSGAALTEGIQTHRIEGTDVRVYSPAKTVADLFKYRNKIGEDVAWEALREALREKLCTVDELVHFGKICRVDNVMKPYFTAALA